MIAPAPAPAPTLRALALALAGLSAVALHAQGPAGYLGKRQTLELGVDYNPFVGWLVGNPRGEGFRKLPGVALQYEYLVGRGRALGLHATHTSLGTLRDDDVDVASSETLVLAEYVYRKGHEGVVGSSYGVGVGLAYYRAVGDPLPGDGFAVGGSSGLATPAVSLGWRYRYVFGDRLAVTPWTRFALPFASVGEATGGRERSPEVPVPMGLATYIKTGVSVGIVW